MTGSSILAESAGGTGIIHLAVVPAVPWLANTLVRSGKIDALPGVRAVRVRILALVYVLGAVSTGVARVCTVAGEVVDSVDAATFVFTGQIAIDFRSAVIYVFLAEATRVAFQTSTPGRL